MGLTIPAPMVSFGGKCRVSDYRTASRRWETGTVTSLSYEATFGPKFSWSYRVRLNRLDRHNRHIYLTCGDEGILQPIDGRTARAKGERG